MCIPGVETRVAFPMMEAAFMILWSIGMLRLWMAVRIVLALQGALKVE